MIGSWSCVLADGGTAEEMVLRHGNVEAPRLLVIPPLFGEHNLMRRQLVEVMRHLAQRGVASVLPDLPGWNESLAPLELQTLATWQAAMSEAIKAFEVKHVFAVRSGALLIPAGLNGWSYAPQSGAKLLRAMVRARTIASRESGRTESSAEIQQKGREQGINLLGWPLNAQMFRELERAEPVSDQHLHEIAQTHVGGQPLWLRAEPAEDHQQAEKLAQIISEGLISEPGESS